jgi:hypothetical protein
MMEMDPISEMCSFVVREYQIMARNPENYMLVLSPFVKLGITIKIAVPSMAKKQSHGTDYGFFHCACPLASTCTFFQFIKHKQMCPLLLKPQYVCSN